MLLISHAVRIPTLVGLLITGVIAGPHGLRLVRNLEEVELLAEVGLILLLFTIGLEFSVTSLLKMKRSVLAVGSLQVGVTVAVGAILMVMVYGVAPERAVFIGMLIALSSTAMVMRLIQDRGDVNSTHGRMTFGALIFQDLAILPMMLAVPLLAGGTTGEGRSIDLLSATAALAGLAAFARWGVKPLLERVVSTRSRELFMLTVAVIGLLVAYLTSSVGLSLALGAFLAGLMISDSEYGHQALGNMLPFRDLFMAFFFVSVGMLLDWRFVVENPLLVLSFVLGVIFLKSVVASGVGVLLRYPVRTAVIAGLSLSQVGEFSFVLAGSGLGAGLITDFQLQLFLAVSVATMILTPVLMRVAPTAAQAVSRVGRSVSRTPSPLFDEPESDELDELARALDLASAEGHLVIVGFGLNGENVAKAASIADIPYVIVEGDPDRVRGASSAGEPIVWGDATQDAILRHVRVDQANVLMVGISDAPATRRIVELARRINPAVHIIARTRAVTELMPLTELGADEVVPEELETSVEIFTRVLRKYKVPQNEIEEFAEDIRESGYELFRGRAWSAPRPPDLARHFPGLDVIALPLSADSPLVGKRLADLHLRETHGFTVLMVKRAGKVLSHEDKELTLAHGDVVCGVATSESAAGVRGLSSEEPE